MKRKLIKRFLYTLLVLFILANIVAISQAYRFTHFLSPAEFKEAAKSEGAFSKIKTLIFGIKIERPENDAIPKSKFQTLFIQSDKRLEGWLIPVDNSKGTIILFHGYTDSKSSLLKQANLFRQMGYNAFLVDFMGSGGSEGSHTTIGFDEATEVRDCFNFIRKIESGKVYLYGVSMGAVAIMKAVKDYDLKPEKIILECPFSSMYRTVENRFDIMGVPKFPLAGLLVFWGGLENGYWAFGFNPAQYAKSIKLPTLLIWGGKDPKVGKDETEKIFKNLAGSKKLVIYPNAHHADYLNEYQSEWTHDVAKFLGATNF